MVCVYVYVVYVYKGCICEVCEVYMSLYVICVYVVCGGVYVVHEYVACVCMCM